MIKSSYIYYSPHFWLMVKLTTKKHWLKDWRYQVVDMNIVNGASQNIYEEVPSSRSRLGWCIHGLLKHTVIYVTFWSPKLRRQFSENLVLWIYEFLFILVIEFSKKKIIEVPRIKNLKYDRNVQLTNCFFFH